MTMIIKIPGIASSGVNWPVLPVVSSDFPDDGLASYLAVQGATLDTGGNVASMAKWYGADQLVQASLASAPEIVTVSGKELLRFTRASSERLISPPAPTSGGLVTTSTEGYSVAIPIMLRETTTNLQGIARFFEQGVRLVIDGVPKLQVQELNGTVTSVLVAWDFSVLAVLGITYDDVTKTIKIYRNGVQVATSTNATWNFSPTASMALGGFFTGSDFGNLDAGDLARWTRSLTADEMLAASGFLMGRFGIA